MHFVSALPMLLCNAMHQEADFSCVSARSNIVINYTNPPADSQNKRQAHASERCDNMLRSSRHETHPGVALVEASVGELSNELLHLHLLLNFLHLLLSRLLLGLGQVATAAVTGAAATEAAAAASGRVARVTCKEREQVSTTFLAAQNKQLAPVQQHSEL